MKTRNRNHFHMNMWLRLPLALCMATALCACAPAAPAAEPEVTNAPATQVFTLVPEATAAPAPEPVATPAPEAGDAPAPEAGYAPNAALGALTALLSDVAESYQPATAGSSLTAARLAGALLDWYAQERPDAASISGAAEAFRAGLDADAAALFSEQLSAVYDAARALTGDNAEDYLESAGYTPTAFPWAQSDIEALFAALGANAGVQ